jgi:hypothetical protein
MLKDQSNTEQGRRIRSLCGRCLPRKEFVHNTIIRAPIVDLIRADHPQWPPEDFTCHADLSRARST